MGRRQGLSRTEIVGPKSLQDTLNIRRRALSDLAAAGEGRQTEPAPGAAHLRGDRRRPDWGRRGGRAFHCFVPIRPGTSRPPPLGRRDCPLCSVWRVRTCWLPPAASGSRGARSIAARVGEADRRMRVSDAPEGWPFAEPYKAKMIEPIRLLPAEDREKAIRHAGFNPFLLQAQDVYIDLLTDSGTGAMSQDQWSALMRGDESYAGSLSFQELGLAVTEILGFPHLLPVHQGRAAEHILFRTLVKPGQVVPNNMHFDTTKAHVLNVGAQPVDLVIDEGRRAEGDHPFKGNVDVARLDDLLQRHGEEIPLVMVTVTSNQNGGQPVSLANLRAVRQVCDRHGKLLFLDAARFAENAFLIQRREPGQTGRTIPDIALDIMSLADGCTISAKKDPLVNIGGLLVVRDRVLFEALRTQTILYEGYATYGGLAGRDLAALAQGLRESVDEAYLTFRVGQVARLHAALRDADVPVVSPAGGHGVYIDAAALLPTVPRHAFPAWALSVELYRERGIRAVEIGTVLAGRDAATGEHDYPAMDLVRLAIPRRVYSDAHLAQVAEATRRIARRRETVPGYRMVYEAPVLRHFTARFEPV